MNSFYKNYYEKLKTAYESGKPSILYNNDRSHNAVIMCFMFDYSDVVSMYCGQMSVLRKDFYRKINETNKIDGSNFGDELESLLKKSLDGFLSREGTRLDVLFESYTKDYILDLVSEESMKAAFDNKKLFLKVLPEDLKIRETLDHFTVSDKDIYRFEDDKEQHSAICSLNNKTNTLNLRQNFQILYNLEGNRSISLC